MRYAITGSSEQVSRVISSRQAITANDKVIAEAVERASYVRAPWQESRPTRSVTSLDERLFDARASFKVITSRYAMHLGTDWRDRLFSQVDRLLDADDWDPRDAPVTPESVRTFLRLMVFLKCRRPGLGASIDGNLIASWSTQQNYLTIVCRPNDELRWTVSVTTDGRRETAAGTTMLTRLPAVLSAYDPNQWFDNEGRATT